MTTRKIRRRCEDVALALHGKLSEALGESLPIEELNYDGLHRWIIKLGRAELRISVIVIAVQAGGLAAHLPKFGNGWMLSCVLLDSEDNHNYEVLFEETFRGCFVTKRDDTHFTIEVGDGPRLNDKLEDIISRLSEIDVRDVQEAIELLDEPYEDE